MSNRQKWIKHEKTRAKYAPKIYLTIIITLLYPFEGLRTSDDYDYLWKLLLNYKLRNLS